MKLLTEVAPPVRRVDNACSHSLRGSRFGEGEAVLRMKGDLYSENSALWDPAAYRVMFHAHPRTGDAWCIYPTYDFTHCIVDSIENVSRPQRLERRVRAPLWTPCCVLRAASHGDRSSRHFCPAGRGSVGVWLCRPPVPLFRRVALPNTCPAL